MGLAQGRLLRPPRQRRLMYIGLGAVLLVIIIIVVLILFLRRR